MGLLSWWRQLDDSSAGMILFIVLSFIFAGLFYAQTQQTKEFEMKLYNQSLENAMALCNFDPDFFHSENFSLNYSNVTYNWLVNETRT